MIQTKRKHPSKLKYFTADYQYWLLGKNHQIIPHLIGMIDSFKLRKIYSYKAKMYPMAVEDLFRAYIEVKEGRETMTYLDMAWLNSVWDFFDASGDPLIDITALVKNSTIGTYEILIAVILKKNYNTTVDRKVLLNKVKEIIQTREGF